jgi:hypothetical protein
MVLFETWTLGHDFLSDRDLECVGPELRGVEYGMRAVIRQAEEIGDDAVVEPVWRCGWHLRASGYGVDIASAHAVDAVGGDLAYNFQHPIRTPADLDRLTPRTFGVDRAASQAAAARLDALFGDLLPVVLHGTTAIHSGLTQDLFKLIGNDNLLLWAIDEPDALRRAMAYLRDDRLAWHGFLEREGLLGANANNTIVGSGSPGFVSNLPDTTPAGGAKLNQLWTWMESQETTMVSPAMFAKFFLSDMAAVAKDFGLVYYGCCEAVHDRWDSIKRAIPNIRAVSISPWCDQKLIAEKLGKTVVFSRKPKAAPMSGETPDWDVLKADLDSTLAAARDCNLEILFRDVYRIAGDRPRLRRWVEMVRARIGGR